MTDFPSAHIASIVSTTEVTLDVGPDTDDEYNEKYLYSADIYGFISYVRITDYQQATKTCILADPIGLRADIGDPVNIVGMADVNVVRWNGTVVDQLAKVTDIVTGGAIATSGGRAEVNNEVVHGTPLKGSGTKTDPWGPA